MKIQLAVRQQSHVPSFKNKKRVTRSGGLITDPEIKKWMERCIRSFESQLLCITQTTGGVTLTAPPPHSLIASSLPLDDSRQWLGEIHILQSDVAKGEEGATIIIERLL